MSFSSHGATGVASAVQRRGEIYFRRRAAALVRRTQTGAEFDVRGGRTYRVTFLAAGGRLLTSCDCPYLLDHGTVCKHVWAALLEARRVNAFPEAHGLVRFQVMPALHPAVGDASGWRGALDLLQPVLGGGPSRPLPAVLQRGELIYVLEPQIGSALAHGILLRLLGRARKPNGGWAKPRSVSLAPSQFPLVPREEDRRILSLLSGAAGDLWGQWGWLVSPLPNPMRIHPEAAAVLLPALCATGRLFLEEPGEATSPTAWDAGDAWQLGMSVEGAADGPGWRVQGTLSRGAARLELSRVAGIFGSGFLLAEGRIARFEPAAAYRLLQHLTERDAFTIPEEEGVPFVAALLAQRPRLALTVPEALRFEEGTGVPRPEIRIVEPQWRWVGSRLEAHLTFDYAGTRLAAGDEADSIVDRERRHVLRRDREAETQAIARLQALGFRLPPSSEGPRTTSDFEVSERHLPKAVRALLGEGWRVEAENLRYRAPGKSSVRVASGVDWFELQGEVDYEGQIVPLPALLRALRDGQGFVALGDGSFGLLPEDWLRRHARLAELGKLEATGVRFGSAQAGLLDALLAELPEATCDATFARARARLQSFRTIEPAECPRAFRGTLRPYQRDGLGWLQFLREFGFGGCLADDMGLGKTVQVLALLTARKERKTPRLPSLVVVPRSLVFNWKEEAARFAPSLKVLDHTGLDRAHGPGDLASCDLVLTTYGTLRRDAPWLARVEFDTVILDEAQAIKNARSQSAKAARLLRARHRLALSGTPIENHLGELWSLFEFLNPGMLGASPAFRLGDEALRNPQGEARALLTRALRPFLLRRTKAEVAPDLPSRTEQTLWCTLGPEQRAVYDELRAHYRATLLQAIDREGMAKAKLEVLEALLRLRQAACHLGLLDRQRHPAASAKLDALLPHLAEVVESGHKALVFSQFTSFLALLRPLMETAGLAHAYLDGQTPASRRKEAVARFQEDPSCPVFLISLKAGGLGLNLTAAEYVYLLDPWWNPAVEAQAVDRAHRIGQTRAVFAYRLVARDTVEEKILELQARKRALADAILGADAGLLKKMTREDVERLLA